MHRIEVFAPAYRSALGLVSMHVQAMFRALRFPLIFSTTLILLGRHAHALDNGLALTPQMGWNTWNHFGCSISADLVASAAKALVDYNLTAYGYECRYSYERRARREADFLCVDIVMDDCELPSALWGEKDLVLMSPFEMQVGMRRLETHPQVHLDQIPPVSLKASKLWLTRSTAWA